MVISGPRCGCGLSTSFNMVEWMTHFSVLLVFFYYFGNFFQILLIFLIVSHFQRVNCGCLTGLRCVTSGGELGTLKCSRIKVPFVNIG